MDGKALPTKLEIVFWKNTTVKKAGAGAVILTLASKPGGILPGDTESSGSFSLAQLQAAYAANAPAAVPQPKYCNDINIEGSCNPGHGVMLNIANTMIVALTYADGRVAAGRIEPVPVIPAPLDDSFYVSRTVWRSASYDGSVPNPNNVSDCFAAIFDTFDKKGNWGLTIKENSMVEYGPCEPSGLCPEDAPAPRYNGYSIVALNGAGSPIVVIDLSMTVGLDWNNTDKLNDIGFSTDRSFKYCNLINGMKSAGFTEPTELFAAVYSAPNYTDYSYFYPPMLTDPNAPVSPKCPPPKPSPPPPKAKPSPPPPKSKPPPKPKGL